MSSSTVPIQSKVTASNLIHWNDPIRASFPLCLKPANWCGRQWQKITTLDGQNTCSKICQVILRVIPAIFLSLATIFAFVVGFMGSCVSAKPVEYTLVNMQDARDTIREDAVKLRASLLQNITEAKVPAALDSFEISEKVMEAINTEIVKKGERAVTAKQLKDMLPIITKILNGMAKILNGMAKDQEEEVKELAEKKLQAELKPKAKAQLETKQKGNSEAVIKTEEKVTVNTKSTSQKSVDTKAKTKDVAPIKDSVKASASVLVFGKLDVAFGKQNRTVGVASLASNSFQRVANAFQKTATPTLSEVVKVAVLDGLRTLDSQTAMKIIISNESAKETAEKIPGPMMKGLVALICLKVMPALMNVIEPALLDPSSRAKVAQWAQNVSSIKMQLQAGEKSVVKIIVA